MTSNIKCKVVVGSLQDTVRTIIRQLKWLMDSILTYEHMRLCCPYSCLGMVFAWIAFEWVNPTAVAWILQFGNIASWVRSVGVIGTFKELAW